MLHAPNSTNGVRDSSGGQILAPQGATEGSHGWSRRRRRNPWKPDAMNPSAPAGTEECPA